MFKVDYNNTGMEPVKPGEYEVFPMKYDIEVAQSGNQRVIVNYKIRADVDQPCQDQEIKFDNFTVTDNSMWRFNQAAKAAGIPDGAEFNDAHDWANAFMNRAVRVVVADKQYNGNTYPEVKSFKESSFPTNGKSSSIIYNNSGKPIEMSSDDLPF